MRSLILRVISLLVLGFPGGVSAQVYKCIDEATGKMTFTDVACPDKKTGDYVPVQKANRDSGYSSNSEMAARKRDDERRQREKFAEIDRMVEESDRRERVEKHEKKAKRLEKEADWETDSLDSASLRKQAAIEREAAAVSSNAKAEQHYENASRYREQSRYAKDFHERAKLVGQANAEHNAARREAGLPPIVEQVPPAPVAPPAPPTPQPSVITNCDGGGCWDNVGNRYNEGAGGTYFRSDGKTCQIIGGNMQCN